MRGRKPVPTVMANLHGRPSKNRPPQHEPKPVGDLSGTGPDWMTESQRACWSYAIENAPPGLLKLIDRGALAVWVVAEDLHRQASVSQSSTGLLVKTKDAEYPIQSPYLPIINRQGLIMLKAASDLGFTPVARPRIVAGNYSPGPDTNGGRKADQAKRGGHAPAQLDDYLNSPPDRPTLN